MKKNRTAIAAIFVAGIFITSCGASKGDGGGKTFCDTAACMKDTLRFTGNTPQKPYLWITAENCRPGEITRSYTGMGSELATEFGFPDVKVNKDYIRCLFNGNEYAWILFNDCVTGRGYQYKLPFSKTGSISKNSSGLNSIDPKFSVAENVVAYTDRGNIFIEDVNTGKKGMMTFGKAIEIDYDVIHESIDSVNITNQRIWAKIKQDGKWVELEKAVTLQ
jgi:hypothetical protein